MGLPGNLDPNKAVQGATPLHAACTAGHAAVVELLLEDPRVLIGRPSPHCDVHPPPRVVEQRSAG